MSPPRTIQGCWQSMAKEKKTADSWLVPWDFRASPFSAFNGRVSLFSPSLSPAHLRPLRLMGRPRLLQQPAFLYERKETTKKAKEREEGIGQTRNFACDKKHEKWSWTWPEENGKTCYNWCSFVHNAAKDWVRLEIYIEERGKKYKIGRKLWSRSPCSSGRSCMHFVRLRLRILWGKNVWGKKDKKQDWIANLSFLANFTPSIPCWTQYFVSFSFQSVLREKELWKSKRNSFRSRHLWKVRIMRSNGMHMGKLLHWTIRLFDYCTWIEASWHIDMWQVASVDYFGDSLIIPYSQKGRFESTTKCSKIHFLRLRRQRWRRGRCHTTTWCIEGSTECTCHSCSIDNSTCRTLSFSP